MSITVGSTDVKNIYIGSTPIKSVYVGTTKVRPVGWQPGANTLGYYPLEQDANDYSGNGYNGSATNVTYTTLASGKKVGTFNGTSSKIYVTNSIVTQSPFTFNIWAYKNSNNFVCMFSNVNPNNNNIGLYADYYNNVGQFRFCTGGNNASVNVSGNNQTRYNWCYTFDGTAYLVYQNGVLKNSGNRTDTSLGGIGASIGYEIAVNGRVWKGYLSELIIEDKVRTATEVSDYYNLTKGNYGL